MLLTVKKEWGLSTWWYIVVYTRYMGRWEKYQLKKMLSVKSFELFYLRQNEDYSLGDSISYSAKKLLQRGGGKISNMWFWWRGGYVELNTWFLQKVSASYEEQTLPWRILVLSLIWRNIRIGLIKSVPKSI